MNDTKQKIIPGVPERFTQRYTGTLNLQKYCYWKYKSGRNPSVVEIAKVGDNLIRLAKRKTLNECAAATGYEVKTRNEITNYRARKIPKIRIGKYAFYLEKIKAGNASELTKKARAASSARNVKKNTPSKPKSKRQMQWMQKTFREMEIESRQIAYCTPRIDKTRGRMR